MRPLAFDPGGLPSSGTASRKLTPDEVAIHPPGGMAGMMLLALIAAPRSTEELLRLVYSGTDAPLCARECIYNQVGRLRLMLKPQWEIASVDATGYRDRRYVLRPRSDRDVT